MKNRFLFSALLIIGLFQAQPETAFAGEYVSIETLTTQKKVKAQFKGLGSYSGPCVLLSLENLGKDTAYVRLEPGRRLDNPDSGAQDILVLRELLFVLLPHQKQSAEVFGFCCQAGNAAPKGGTEFGVGQMAGGNLQWIAEFMNAQKFDISTIQQTVWVFSDGHNAASIIGCKDPKIMSLRKAVAQKLGIVLPWYDIFYKKEPNQLFSGKHQRLTGEVKFRSNSNGFVHINVRNTQGLLMTTIASDMGVESRSYSYPIDIPVENWAAGKYYVNVYLDGNFRSKQEFVL